MGSVSPAARPRPEHLVGLLCVSSATLLLQVCWTRVLSVSLWYHFAFLVVSTAMLGFGLAGVILTLSTRLRRAPLQAALPLLAGGQAAVTLLGYWLANAVPFAPFALLSDRSQLLYAPLYMLCISAPFVFSGMCAALLLSRFPSFSGRIYCVDLLGAGIGCALFVAVMPLGGSPAIVLSAAGAALAAALFTRGWPRVAASTAVIALVLLSFHADGLLPLRISQTKAVGNATAQQALESEANLFSGWNTFSRIDVLPAAHGRSILIDAGTAVSRMPRVRKRPSEMGPITDERSLVLKPGGRQTVLVIGSGGGWEVLAALRNGAQRVVAIEVNPLINRLVLHDMAQFVGGIFAHPAVELHTDEARSFIRRETRQFDVIMASHTISNAATASGALSLAENYVLTVEAFVDYLDHLSPDGLLWFSRPEQQIARLMTTARAALAQKGIRRAEHHIIAFAGGTKPSFYGGIVAGLRPFPPAFLQRARAQFQRSGLRTLYLPNDATSPPEYRRLMTASSVELEQLYAATAHSLHPTSDDQPFFNQRSRWSALDLQTIGGVFKQSHRGRMALEDQPVAEVVLLVVLVQSSLLALAFVVLPLWLRRRWGLQGAGGPLAYFLLLGLGFILTEIALIQRLTLFIGQPTHTFAVVVGALLVSSGLGSLFSERWVQRDDQLVRRLRLLLGAIVVALLAVALISPPLLRACLGLQLTPRIIIAVLLLAPLGGLLGTAFPLGLRYAGKHVPRLIPWAWGLNAVASVVGSVAAIVLATMVGFSGVLLAAAATYVCAQLVWVGRQ